MAFATHWRTEFDDIHGTTWKVDIQEDSYGGSVVDLKATGRPLEIEWMVDDEMFNSPIHPSRAKINVYSTTDFALASLYSEQDWKYKVIIYYESTVYWQGFIETGTYEEPYEEPSYEVSIPAIDGLAYLKTIMFDDAGSYYTGRTFESQLILNILGKIQITAFKEYVNLYESSMDSGTTDSPCDQLKIDVSIFRDMNCFEVLSEVLKKYDAVIIQSLGDMVIYRPVEMKGSTVYGRSFTAATTKTGISIAPAQYINRTVNTSDLVQVRGSWLSVRRGFKNIKIGQDYGYKESIINTWEMTPDQYDADTATWDNWTGNAFPFYQVVPEEKVGMWISAVSSQRSDSVYQSFGTYLVETTDVFGFSFDYNVYSYNGSSLSTVEIQMKIKCDSSSKYLTNDDEESLQWSDSEAYITILFGSIPNGRSGWVTFARKIPGIPTTGSYTITIYNPYCATSFAFGCAYKNIKFFGTSDTVLRYRTKTYTWGFGWLTKWKKVFKYTDRPEITVREYLKTNTNGAGQFDIDYMLGDVEDSGIDNVIEQFGGSLMTYITVPGYRVDTVTLAGTSGDIDITCDGLTRRVSFDTNLTDTAAAFVSAYESDYAAQDITVTSSGADIIFTNDVAGDDYTGDTTAENVSGDITGSVVATTPANTYTIDYSTVWNSRGGSEATELIDLVGDEIKAQYARPKQMIAMNIQEKNASQPTLNIVKRIEDEINQYSGSNRNFVFISGRFDVKNKLWTPANLIEIL